jgi:hypothetical protein
MGRPNCPRAVAPRSTAWKADTHTFSDLSQKSAGRIAASAKPAAIDAPALEVTSRFLHAGLNPAGQWAPLELGHERDTRMVGVAETLTGQCFK